ncbi:alpha/beta hydrolase [bacterium]|nr:alpha/beta hydrolase [bacterium]
MDYSSFDRPEITNFLFHPRAEYGEGISEEGFEEIMIPVEKDVEIGARFYGSEKNSPVLLFFHGNGEIVADYHDISQLYTRMNVNFFPIDYRGYGKSSGRPSVTTMMRDSQTSFKFALDWLTKNGYTGNIIIMGRSLGSAAALEIASNFEDRFSGLIIESGFAFAVPLLRLLGINAERLGMEENKGFRNFDKIKKVNKPTLVIHAENDHIIPFQDGKYLYDNCMDENKSLLMIPDANHNDIFARGLQVYMQAVKQLIERAIAQR